MSTKLKAQYDTMERSRRALLDSLKQYPDNLLNKQPAPGKWSVAQVLDHIIAGEEGSLSYIKKKTQDIARAQPAGLRGRWRMLMLKVVFSSPVTFKAPPVLEPSQDFMTLQQLDERWTKVRAGIYAIISKLSDKDLEKELWKHIIAGKMNIYQMLSFLDIHYKRHKKQTQRTLKAVG
jgi:uncharacterized damage-inducible protein DinB